MWMPQTVAQVIREEKADRVIRSVLLILKLQLAAATIASTPFTKRDRSSPSPLSVDQTVKLSNAGKSFDGRNRRWASLSRRFDAPHKCIGCSS